MDHTLCDRIEELEEENRQLREKLYAPVSHHYGDLHLTRAEIAIVSALESTAAGNICAIHHLLDCIMTTRGPDDAVDPQIIRVYISRIRQKIAPLRIRNQWGLGYWLDDKAKAALKKLKAGNGPQNPGD